jgi:hypothetical protein
VALVALVQLEQEPEGWINLLEAGIVFGTKRVLLFRFGYLRQRATLPIVTHVEEG